jgi:hypothetical protein
VVAVTHDAGSHCLPTGASVWLTRIDTRRGYRRFVQARSLRMKLLRLLASCALTAVDREPLRDSRLAPVQPISRLEAQRYVGRWLRARQVSRTGSSASAWPIRPPTTA